MSFTCHYYIYLYKTCKTIFAIVCKKKQATNTRAAGSDEALHLSPPVHMSLEQCLEFIQEDDLLEVTPQNIRIRKKELDHAQRMKQLKRGQK